MDALRGFALVGILMVNILVLGQPSLRYVLEPGYWEGGADRAAFFGVHFLFRGQFITLFSFLFGVGFAMMAGRLMEKDVAFRWVYGRRVAMLLAFGLVHVLALWYGDILVTYALCGMLLPLFLNRSERTLKVWIGVALLLPVVGAGVMAALTHAAHWAPEWGDGLLALYASAEERAEQDLEFLLSGYAASSFGEVFRARMTEAAYLGNDVIQVPYIFALFLLGVLVGRRGYPHRLVELMPAWRRWLPLLLGAGFTLNAFWYLVEGWVNPFHPDVRTALWAALFVTATPFLAAGYAVTFLHFYGTRGAGILGRGLAAMGQMALTNYLLQSVVATSIFYGYGLGLYGQLGPAALVGLAMAILLLQMGGSAWYLRHFRRGPLEWLWRRVTYGRAL